MTANKICLTLGLLMSLPLTSASASDACDALNLLEVSAALRGPGEVVSTHGAIPDKKLACGVTTAFSITRSRLIGSECRGRSRKNH